jgi:hypothetical protein
MISRCREIRDRTMNRSEWSSERTTDATNRGYLRTYVTSIDAMRTVFLAATLCYRVFIIALSLRSGPLKRPRLGDRTESFIAHSFSQVSHTYVIVSS